MIVNVKNPNWGKFEVQSQLDGIWDLVGDSKIKTVDNDNNKLKDWKIIK